METITIEIRNPKAKRILKNLADLNLIVIKPKVPLKVLLEKMRSSQDEVPSLDEITAEVEQVRQTRNAKKA